MKSKLTVVSVPPSKNLPISPPRLFCRGHFSFPPGASTNHICSINFYADHICSIFVWYFFISSNHICSINFCIDHICFIFEPYLFQKHWSYLFYICSIFVSIFLFSFPSGPSTNHSCSIFVLYLFHICFHILFFISYRCLHQSYLFYKLLHWSSSLSSSDFLLGIVLMRSILFLWMISVIVHCMLSEYILADQGRRRWVVWCMCIKWVSWDVLHSPWAIGCRCPDRLIRTQNTTQYTQCYK